MENLSTCVAGSSWAPSALIESDVCLSFSHLMTPEWALEGLSVLLHILMGCCCTKSRLTKWNTAEMLNLLFKKKLSCKFCHAPLLNVKSCSKPLDAYWCKHASNHFGWKNTVIWHLLRSKNKNVNINYDIRVSMDKSFILFFDKRKFEIPE